MRGPLTLVAALFALCASCCPPPKAASCCESKPDFEPVMHVVLVHGFLERGSNFKMLRDRLEKKRIGCHVVRLKPSDGRIGLDKLAESLKEQIIEKIGGDTPFSMVGFSMGGLVSRYYLQNLGGAGRCEQFITIASPHHGTIVAKLYPGKGARQMRPNSEFLKQLKESEHNLGDMPVTSYRTPLDLIILPSNSSVWERAENRMHYALLHPFMLNIPSVLKDVEKRLLGTLNDPPAQAGRQ